MGLRSLLWCHLKCHSRCLWTRCSRLTFKLKLLKVSHLSGQDILLFTTVLLLYYWHINVTEKSGFGIISEMCGQQLLWHYLLVHLLDLMRWEPLKRFLTGFCVQDPFSFSPPVLSTGSSRIVLSPQLMRHSVSALKEISQSSEMKHIYSNLITDEKDRLMQMETGRKC